ncbi:ArgS-related anticodon-binding protein NrtL [Streptomyces sp. NBC_00299]|uniref:ArgS-related anticodon-binding protein NrtL n=1 Tax=Streptomyces sp. NBC_00299 TaxID=2975705 RepID=UPI002E2E0FD7|nr:DALR anticodon-binding domain-containing protein [Streptomyces sp. NBC_00299]
MTPVELSRTVLRAVRRAVDDGVLCVAVPERVVVTAPGPGGCGDYATNVALQLARPAGRPSVDVAEILQARLLSTDGIRDVVVTGPGFLNISLGDTATTALVEEILRRGTRYGYANGPSADFIPLSCPHEVRAVVVMDALGRILRSQGAAVRTRCEAPLDPRWVDILGVGGVCGVGGDADGAQDSVSPPEFVVRPVPAPAGTAPLQLGRDAARWALLHPAGHDRPRITDEHLVQRESNPLFRVRYAHARTRALSRNAADLGFDAEPGDVRHDVAALLADHPRVLAQAAAHRAPDRLARHLVTVADAVLPLLPAVLPRGAEKPSATHRARLALAEAAGTVLAGGLSLLGIDAPDHL